MTDEELRALVVANAEGIRELREAQKETDQQLKETDRQLKETDRQLKELGIQIGGLGNKFGSFTEGLALNSMSKILRDRFGMECISPRVRIRRGGREVEIDVLAFANSQRNEAVLVEVKSHLGERDVEQMQELLDDFFNLLPEHRGKRLYGILAVVDAPLDLRQQVLARGIYLAHIEDELFALDIPGGFVPRVYTAA